MHILIAALHRPTKPTGVCRHAANLAQCLADLVQVNQVTLVIGTWQRDYFQTAFNLCSQKIHLLEIDIKNSSLSRNAWFLFGLPKLAAILCADIIHLSFPIPFLRSLFPCPVVATIHDLYPYECPENFGFPQVLFNRLFLKQCVNSSDALCCVSKVTLERLDFYFPYINKSKFKTVIYNYVNFTGISPKYPDVLINKNIYSFILSVAQHRKNKNLDLLIESYYCLLESGEIKAFTKLIIVGSQGPETDNLARQISKLSLSEQVIMLSSLDDSELCWLYKNCELFVIPSATEGFCLPLAEALELNCQVVCSDIPIFREIGSDECTFFNLSTHSVQHLSQAIIQVRLSADQANYHSRFNRKIIANQYLELYSKIITSKYAK